MNIAQFHTSDQAVQAKRIFTGEGQVNSMQLLAGGLLKEHVSAIPALLICVKGKAVYEDETGLSETLVTGDYVNILPNVKHWLKGIENSNLLLLK